MSSRSRRSRLAALTLVAGAAALAAPAAEAAVSVIPKPASLEHSGKRFAMTKDTRVVAGRGAGGEAAGLAALLRRSTGYSLPLRRHAGRKPAIELALGGARRLGREGYTLRVSRHGVRLRARTPVGLFRGVQTLRQLLPAKVESASPQPGPWRVPGVRIADRPRFPWRGAHLDVSRHFFSVAEVKRYIDLISQYKVNVLHLHLSDDQGWRLQLRSRPLLTERASATSVGGDPGGFYTRDDYRAIVDHAASRHMTVVPEIDLPGHTNAALASYADLNCDGVAPPLYTGTEVGFSSLCTTKEITYDFLDDVFGEVAAQSPGPMLHLGGDEAHSTPHEEYLDFVPRASALVTGHGKRVMGWQEIAETPLPPGSIAQYWGTDDARSQNLARQAVAQDAEVVMSPANRVYLDMKYDPDTPYGLTWAGYVPVRKAYDWDPDTLIPGVREPDIAGVEAPLWAETLDEIGKVEFMAFPRLAGVAEIGWSPASARSWQEYRHRLGGQAPRWEVLDVNYFAAPEIPWQ